MDTKIDLLKFCKKTAPSKYNIKEPFSFGRWTYATDGRIAVRVDRWHSDDCDTRDAIIHDKPCNCYWRVNPDAPHDHMQKLFLGPHKIFKWVDVPKVVIEQIDCDCCDGWDPECDECNGTGKLDVLKATEFEVRGQGVLLSNTYLKLIADNLPNPKIGLTDQTKWRPVMIEFDCGDGLLMPCCWT